MKTLEEETGVEFLVTDSKNTELNTMIDHLCSAHRFRLSNCFGTIAYLFDVEGQVLGLWESIKELPEINKRKMCWDYISFDESLYGKNMPGYIGPLPMKLFMAQSREVRKISRKDAKGNVVCFFDELMDVESDRVLIHSAIYLGGMNGEEMIFHQAGAGGVFEVAPLRRYIWNRYSNHVYRDYERRGVIPQMQFFGIGSSC